MGEARWVIVSSPAQKEQKGRIAVRMQKEAAFRRGADCELVTTFGVVKAIECSDSRRMESQQHHGSVAKLIVNHCPRCGVREKGIKGMQ
jgi:hypothetical protein